MKICVLADSNSVHTKRWAKAYRQNGHEVHLVSIRRNKIDGVHCHVVNVGASNSTSFLSSLLSYLLLLLKIKGILKKISPDIIDAHYSITYGAIGCFSQFHPIVVNLWGSDIIWSGKGKQPLWARLILKYVLEKADCITSSSRYMMEYARNITPKIKKLAQIPFGVDCETFQPKDAAGVENVVGYLKTMSVKYGPYVFLDSVPMILREIPMCRFVMVGRGDELVRLKKLAKKLDIADKVTFKDFVEHDKITGILNTFDVYVNPSICKESFGVSILEASACGVPTVASNTGGIPEVCIDNKTGFLFDVGSAESLSEAVIKILKNDDIKKDFGENGRKMVLENYDWQNCMDKKIALFKSLIKGD